MNQLPLQSPDIYLQIKEMVSDFTNDIVRPVADELDVEERFPEEIYEQMADLGLFGITSPEEWGGAGLDCYAYALLALGQIDLVIEAGLQPYDIAAPIAVIEAAGGLVTNWEGGPADGGGRVVAASCASLHSAALDLIGATA